MKTKKSTIIFGIAIMTLMIRCGDVFAKEIGAHPTACDKRFSDLDSTHKGYLVPENFRRELEGPPDQNRKIMPYGKVLAGFAAADRNGDGIVTPNEFCAWDSNRK